MSQIDVSVIVLVSDRYGDVEKLYWDYKEHLESAKTRYELLYVLDGDFPEVYRKLRALQEIGEQLRIVRLAKRFGESTALTAGFERASGECILTLPPYYQVEPAEIGRVLEAMTGVDFVTTRRWPRKDSRFNQWQTKGFNGVLSMLTGTRIHDLGSGVRAFRRRVMEEIPVYGDQYRFFPVLAEKKGFRIREIDVQQSSVDCGRRVYRFGTYLRRLLDMLTVFFLVKFTKKPLRFFGLIGLTTFAVGAVFLLYLVFERLAWSVPLADRPALLLSSLLVVLGIQVFALGLLGELIIFAHANEIKEYTIEEVVN